MYGQRAEGLECTGGGAHLELALERHPVVIDAIEVGVERDSERHRGLGHQQLRWALPRPENLPSTAIKCATHRAKL